MKPWIKRSLFAVLGATVVLGSLSACGHQRHGWGASAEDQARFKEKMVERAASKLDLSEDQKKKLAVVADKLQAQRQALVGQNANPRAELEALIAGPKFDTARAQNLITEKTGAITSQSPEVLAAFADFYDNLNPTQQTRLREFLSKRHGWGHRG